MRIAFCRGLAERDEREEDFVYGWFRRIVNLRNEVESDYGEPAGRICWLLLGRAGF